MSSIRTSLSLTVAGLGLGLAAGTAQAAPDGVLMDPSIGAQSITYWSASDPTPHSLPIVYTPPTRDAFTKTAPLALPCDVSFLAVGLSWKNVSAQPLYIEWAGGVFYNGSERTKIPDGYGRSMVYVADGRLHQPGAVSGGGFIFIAEEPLLSWPATSFPANVPLRLQLETRGFTSDAIDPVRGGYALAHLFAEDIIWNNNHRVWVQRTCP